MWWNKIKTALKKSWQKTGWLKLTKGLFKFVFVVILLIGATFSIFNYFFYYPEFGFGSDGAEDTLNDNCNVYGYDLRGDIVTYIPPEDREKIDDEERLTVDETSSEDLVGALADVKEQHGVRAVLLQVDSYGGSPVAGEEIARALQDLRAAGKTVVVLVRSAADSAAYLAASGAERIFASTNSEVGSLGVTMSYLDYSKKNAEDGLTYNKISSGKFKDTGDPDKNLTAEEKKLLQRDVDVMHDNFVKTVAVNRGLAYEKVAALADGSAMLGEAALANGLIDEVGGLTEVKNYLREKIGAKPEICW